MQYRRRPDASIILATRTRVQINGKERHP